MQVKYNAYDIDDEPGAVAGMMQHFIDGSSAIVKGSTCVVSDTKNEMMDGQMVSAFRLIASD